MSGQIPQDSIQRVAAAAVEQMTADEAKALAKLLKSADLLIPGSIWRLLRQAFTIKGLPFFQFYIKLRRIALGEPVTGGLKAEYKRAADRLARVKSPVDKRSLSPSAINRIALTRPLVNRAINAVEQGNTTPIIWGKLNAVMVPLIVEVAKDKGVWIKATRQQGRERWAIFRKMSAKQERIEKLRDDDPESYALMQQLGQTLEQIDQNIEDNLTAQGLVVERTMIAGKPTKRGIDPGTGEHVIIARDGTRFSGPPPKIVSVDPKTGRKKWDWTETAEAAMSQHERDKAARLAALARVPTRTQVPPKDLRLLSDDALEALTGDVQFDSITDDKAKQGRLTRIFPTKLKRVFVPDPETGETREEFHKVVVEGRYKGIFLDDLINSEGRLIEGTAYTYDVKRGRELKIPKVIDPSDREPYVSMADVVTTRTFQGKRIKVKTKKLFLKIDGSRDSKVLRSAIKKLACNAPPISGCIPSVSYEAVKGSRAAGFYFDPKDFGIIMQSLQGMSLSKAAITEVKGYYKDLAQAEAATENLDAYEPEALNSTTADGESFQFVQGHRRNGEWKPMHILKKQKQAVAWLDANGNNGVCALETGVGKTLTSVTMMMKLVRDGFTEEGASYERPDGTKVRTNGRFLWVCPKSLKGNMPKEIRNFISDPKPLLSRTDVLSYAEFSGASKSGKVPTKLRGVPFWKERHAEWDSLYGEDERAKARQRKERRLEKQKGRTAKRKKKERFMAFDPAMYVSLFFDEAQEMKNPSSGRSQAALKLYHPRKVCLTASPMERNPMEAYVLAAISNNTPLFGPTVEARDNRKEMRRFKERFCEIVGGRIVGVKQDPLVQRDLHTWVKSNIFHADKTQVDEYELEDLAVATTPIVMDKEVEAVYRDLTDQFARIMRGAARKFRERTKGDSYEDKQAERVFSRALRPVMNLMTKLSNDPAAAMRDVAFAAKNGYLPGNVDKEGKPREMVKGLVSIVNKWKEQYQPDDLEGMAAQMGNPKIEAAADLVASALDDAQMGRSLLFADDKDLCMAAGQHMAKTVAGTHVVAMANSIHFFRGGKELDEITYPLDRDLLDKLVKNPERRAAILAEGGGVTTHTLPFGKRAKRRYPELPAHPKDNTHYKADTWQQFVLKELVNPDPTVVSCTLLGQTYMYGHNLQAFSKVIHLDRNNWNSESMKQRTARAWRQGQEGAVTEFTLDTTFSPSTDEGIPRDEDDVTLDQIRASFQDMDAAIFDGIIRDAQDIELGEEWGSVDKKDASLWRLDEKVVEMMSSPMIGRALPPGSG